MRFNAFPWMDHFKNIFCFLKFCCCVFFDLWHRSCGLRAGLALVSVGCALRCIGFCWRPSQPSLPASMGQSGSRASVDQAPTVEAAYRFKKNLLQCHWAQVFWHDPRSSGKFCHRQSTQSPFGRCRVTSRFSTLTATHRELFPVKPSRVWLFGVRQNPSFQQLCPQSR
jgi:hypothetical protein